MKPWGWSAPATVSKRLACRSCSAKWRLRTIAMGRPLVLLTPPKGSSAPTPRTRTKRALTFGSKSSWTGERTFTTRGNEPERASAVLAAVQPVVEARGTAARRQTFYWSLAAQRMRETRYRIDQETLDNLDGVGSSGARG